MLARHPSRANDAGPQALACALRLSGDARLSALHCGICDSGPARDEKYASSPASTSRPLVVAERRLPVPPGNSRACRKRAGHRIPLCLRNASRWHPRWTGLHNVRRRQRSVKRKRQLSTVDGGQAVEAHNAKRKVSVALSIQHASTEKRPPKEMLASRRLYDTQTHCCGRSAHSSIILGDEQLLR